MIGFIVKYMESKGAIEIKDSRSFDRWREENSFNEVVDGYTTKKIDPEAAKYLLLKVKYVLNTNNVPFLLVFGTLLGAYRDGKFIEWDKDVDIAILKEHREKVLQLIKDGEFAFYEIIWIRDVGYLYSLVHKSEYIDFHFFEEKAQGYVSGGVDEHVIKKDQIEGTNSKIMFLGEEFNTVSSIEQYLVDQYGETWKIPTR